MTLQYKSHDVTHPRSDSQIFDSLRLKAKLLTLGPHVLWDLNSHHFSDLHSHYSSHPALLTVSQGNTSLLTVSPTSHSASGHLHLLFVLPCALPLIFVWWAPPPASSLCSQETYYLNRVPSPTLPALSASFFFINFITAYINILQLFVYLFFFFLDSPPLECHTMRVKALEKKQETKTGPSWCLHSKNSTSGH